MNLFKAALITLGFLLCWVLNGFADRLYTWTDAKGMTHITQDPPPDTAKEVDTIDYSSQQNQSVRPSTASDRPNQQQGNPNQGDGQAGSGVSTGTASGDGGDNDEYYYTGNPYRRALRQYDPGINQPGRIGNVGGAGPVGDPGLNQPGAVGNVGGPGVDPGVNQPGAAGNMRGPGRR